MDPNLFSPILTRVRKILKYNYLESFYKERKVDLLSIPTITHKQHLPKLDFNSLDQSPSTNSYVNSYKNFNLFEKLLTKVEDDHVSKVNSS